LQGFLPTSFIIIIAVVVTLFILYKKNEYVRFYFDLPMEVKKESVRLAAYKIRDLVIPYKEFDFNDKNNSAFSSQTNHSIGLGADWLVKMQESSGRFNYWYNPETNTFSEFSDDNFLRQAGTCYSMVNAWEITGDSNYRIAYLKEPALFVTLQRRNGLHAFIFSFSRKGKTGWHCSANASHIKTPGAVRRYFS
jgi:hypothetical protein